MSFLDPTRPLLAAALTLCLGATAARAQAIEPSSSFRPAPTSANGPGSASGPAAGPDAEWRRIEGVALAVDTEIVPWSALIGIFQQRTVQLNITTAEEQREVLAAIIRELLAGRVRVQSGAELPLPDEQVEIRVRQILNERRDELGLVAYGDSLRRDGLDPLAGADEIRQEFYRFAFVDEATGRSQLGLGRPRIDRQLRPRQLLAAYEESLDELGDPDKVQLQMLDITPEMTGGLEQAEQLAQQVFEDLEAGADFEEQFELYAARYRDQRGRTALAATDRLRDLALREFARTAELGAHSDVLTIGSDRGVIEGYRLVRLLDRVEGKPAPAFTEPAFQKTLRTRLQEQLDQQRLARHERRVLGQSAVWIDPAVQLQLGEPESRAPGAPVGPLRRE